MSISDFASRIRSLLSLTPFETATASGRGRERYRVAALTSMASFGSRAISILAIVVSVPLSLKYLGSERYGLWMTMLSLIGFLGFMDLGIGNSLVSRLSAALARDNLKSAREEVSSAFFTLTGTGIAVLAAAAASYVLFDWISLLRITSPIASAEFGATFAVLLLCFAFSLPIGILSRIILACQRGYLPHLGAMIGNGLSVLALFLALRSHLGLPWLVLSFTATPLLATLVTCGGYLLVCRPDLLPKWSAVKPAAIRSLLGAGALFLVLQAASAVNVSSDNIIAARKLGAGAVTLYSICFKLFGFAPLVMTLILLPLWPAYSDAIERRDVAWAHRTLFRSLLGSIVFSGFSSFFLVLLARPLLKLWVGPDIVPTNDLLYSLAVWATIASVWGTVSVFLNGMNAIAFQVLCAIPMTIVCIAAKTLLAPRLGLAGMVWATNASQVLFVIVPQAFYLARMLRRQKVSGLPKEATPRP